MAFTDINSEDRLVQKTFADHLYDVLGWDSVYAWNEETFGPDGTLGREDQKAVVLTRDLRAAIERFNSELPAKAVNEAIEKLTRQDFSRSALQHNQEFYGYIRGGVPVSYTDAKGHKRARPSPGLSTSVIPKPTASSGVRELKITGLRTPTITAAPTWYVSSTVCCWCSSS
ncbi:MAG: type I restriction endonuclease [Pseudomonadales bacterium]